MKQSIRAKRMERNHKRHGGVAKLNLVSLMDIFTILVFFLMVNSSDVEVLQTNKDITLPESVSEKKPGEHLLLTVSDKDILVRGRKVVGTQKVLQSSDAIIAELEQELLYQSSKRKTLTETEQKYGRAVTIMGDAKLPYQLLKKIMVTCAKADYGNISLAVDQVAGETLEQLSSEVSQ